MLQTMTCPQGHQWELDGEHPVLTVNRTCLCPVCGIPVPTSGTGLVVSFTDNQTIPPKLERSIRSPETMEPMACSGFDYTTIPPPSVQTSADTEQLLPSPVPLHGTGDGKRTQPTFPPVPDSVNAATAIQMGSMT